MEKSDERLKGIHMWHLSQHANPSTLLLSKTGNRAQIAVSNLSCCQHLERAASNMEKIGAIVLVVLSITSYVAFATDPSQLQDFALPPKTSMAHDPVAATPEDFLFQGLNIPGNTDNKVGSNVTLVSAANLPGLNTLGISVARVDFAQFGLNPPHIHPRATEVLTVIQGSLFVGFVTSNRASAANQLFSKVLNTGDVFVFPQGLIHFQLNVGKTPAVANVALSSQNPGVVTVANAVFGSTPAIPTDVLTKAFRANNNVINVLQSQFQA
ncbi:hypothetical protein Cgig2_027961 [Carnegiea gigantea]|uniref:Germin-like protein n=1 Tax=Carnegiea gigantea TaxID=171969 RepID=A0A9Q1JVQ5_9CARY|nr:hypothetical protein Cgig2_027961 [Carnegiea gigantea]